MRARYLLSAMLAAAAFAASAGAAQADPQASPTLQENRFYRFYSDDRRVIPYGYWNYWDNGSLSRGDAGR